MALAQARQEAENASRAKDEFLAMLGHELRNPLAPIVTTLQLMRLRGAARATEQRRHRAPGRAPDAARRRPAGRLAHHARQDRARHAAASRSPTSSTRAMEIAAPLARAARVTTCARCAAARAARQRRHRPPGAGDREPPDQRRQVHRSRVAHLGAGDATSGEHVEIRVRDEGIGIAPEMLPRIFDLFIQQPQSLDRSRGGLGLGLAIVRNLTQLHGGTVRAESDGPGHGSEFILKLPHIDLGHASAAALAAPPRESRLADRGCECSSSTTITTRRARSVWRSRPPDSSSTSRTTPNPRLNRETAFRPAVALLDIGLPAMMATSSPYGFGRVTTAMHSPDRAERIRSGRRQGPFA